MIFGVHIASHPIEGGVDGQVLLAVASVAERIHRISDVVVSGGGDPAVIVFRFCVEAGNDHVKAAKIGVEAYKDALRSAGLSGIEIASVSVGPDPCPEDGAVDAAQLVVASR